MKRIFVVTQTYSDNRNMLFDYHNKDVNDIYFRNKFINLYSFHNVSHQNYELLWNYPFFKSINSIITVAYENIPYPLTFKQTLQTLREIGCDYIMFCQDDSFSANTNQNLFDEVFKYVQENNFDMLNLEIAYDLLKTKQPLIYQDKTIEVYNTTSTDFVNRGWYSFDDGAYIASLPYICDRIYDETYFSHRDIWSAEKYLNNKITNFPIQRLTLNIPIYRRFNLIGPNNWDRQNDENLLKKCLNI